MDAAPTTNRRRFLHLAAGTTLALAGTPAASALAAPPATQRLPNPYARWANGPCPRPDPAYFPIGVWLQEPDLAPQYQQAGINLYVGLWEGPTAEQLATLERYGMPVIATQNAVGLGTGEHNPLVGWSHQDEPDNAQPLPEGGYGPPVDPAVIVDRYEQMVAADPTRPVFLNLGQGVANDDWIGRGPDASLEDYPKYAKGADIISFDVYPVADNLPLWYVAKGLDRLREWCDEDRVLWNFVETTNISSDRRVSPHEFRAEVWMSLVHGSRGILYFVHSFAPTFDAAKLLHDPEMLAAVTATNRQIQRLAPILNTRSDPDAVLVRSSDPQVPVDVMVKRRGRVTYVFAVSMRDAPTTATFEFRAGLDGRSRVVVVDEERTITTVGRGFADVFAPYDVHIYQVVHAHH
ncbi:hypothetical protein [Actinopolymorpha pittospori]|uniref:Uncharacterized protein n=1 Tax=Actinopolymorpha pittospori TaxID=648752 RepID=A0A927MYZ9_9ACTN|nr:hypothetical protein [Actinopolymorpha pittospori]MBE1607883.1 hypothetical protein [Actinopolymorpha pittospori]